MSQHYNLTMNFTCWYFKWQSCILVNKTQKCNSFKSIHNFLFIKSIWHLNPRRPNEIFSNAIILFGFALNHQKSIYWNCINVNSIRRYLILTEISHCAFLFIVFVRNIKSNHAYLFIILIYRGPFSELKKYMRSSIRFSLIFTGNILC